MKTKFCRCGNEVHPIRQKYGYNTCVSCSNVEAVACAPLTNHKTGNSIQIMSMSDSVKISKLTRRSGYGTMLRNV